VTAQGYAVAVLDTDAAVALVRGQPVAEARERLLAELPLAEPPEVAIWPERLDRLPLLPLRIAVQVLPQGHVAVQGSATAR
jgi:hypothetical protein